MTPSDLRECWELLPYAAQELVLCLGEEAAGALLDARGGCVIRIPKHREHNPAGTRRWAELVGIIGEPAMAQLSSRFGGDLLEIPTCHAARRELRRRSIRAEFERLTQRGCSAKQAIYEICILYAPISTRAIKNICSLEDRSPGGAQMDLL